MNDKETRQISLDKRKQMLKNLELARDTRAKNLAKDKESGTSEKKKKETLKEFKCVCGKFYVSNAGLKKHIKICKVVADNVEEEKEDETDDDEDEGGSEQEISDSDSEDEETEKEKIKRLKREKREEEKKERREAKIKEDKKKKRKEYNETAYDNKLAKKKKNVKLEIKEQEEVEEEVVEEKKVEPKPIPPPAPPPVKKNIVPSAEPKYHNGQAPVEKYSMAEWKALHEKEKKDRYDRESRIKFEQQEQRINRLKQAMMQGGI